METTKRMQLEEEVKTLREKLEKNDAEKVPENLVERAISKCPMLSGFVQSPDGKDFNNSLISSIFEKCPISQRLNLNVANSNQSAFT